MQRKTRTLREQRPRSPMWARRAGILGAALILQLGLTAGDALAFGRRRQPPPQPPPPVQPPPPPPPTASPDASVIVGHTVPAALGRGASANVTIRVRNTGTST